jgi:hypothetical protein
VSLYLLLMEVRYQLGLPPAGLLWNVNSQAMVLVPAKQEELASLLSCRNRLAAHLWQECPPPPAMLGVSAGGVRLWLLLLLLGILVLLWWAVLGR